MIVNKLDPLAPYSDNVRIMLLDLLKLLNSSKSTSEEKIDIARLIGMGDIFVSENENILFLAITQQNNWINLLITSINSFNAYFAFKTILHQLLLNGNNVTIVTNNPKYIRIVLKRLGGSLDAKSDSVCLFSFTKEKQKCQITNKQP
jgi:hypothetical protein